MAPSAVRLFITVAMAAVGISMLQGHLKLTRVLHALVQRQQENADLVAAFADVPNSRAFLQIEVSPSDHDADLEVADDDNFGRDEASWPQRAQGRSVLAKLFPELGRTYEPRKTKIEWFGYVPRGYASGGSRGGQLLTRTRTFAIGGILWRASVHKPHWDPTASPSTSCRNPGPTGSLPLGEEPAACLHLTAVQARRSWHMEDVVTVRLGVSFLPTSYGFLDLMKAEGMEPATWMHWRNLELNFTSQQPTHSFMLHGWTETYMELWEAYEAIYMKRETNGDKTSRQPFIVQLQIQDPEVSWHDHARHEEAEYRRALSPALTMYRSLEVLGLESLMCGAECGAGSQEEDSSLGAPVSTGVYHLTDAFKRRGPYMRYWLRSELTTFSHAEALAGVLHSCNNKCPVKGGAKQLVRAALHAVAATARDLDTMIELQKPQRLHGLRLRELLPLPRLHLVSNIECCTGHRRRPRHEDDDDDDEEYDDDEEGERLLGEIEALAKTGSEGQALQLALEALAWSSDVSLQPAPAYYCSNTEAANLTHALRSYVAQVLRHAGRIPAEAAKQLREIGAHVHPSHPSFGNIPAEARTSRACRLVPFSGSAANLRRLEGAATASLKKLGAGAFLLASACFFCLTLDIVQVLAIAEIPLIPLRLVWLALSGVWTLLRGTASRGDGREAPARTASDTGRTEPASPRAAGGSGKGRKGPVGSPSAAATRASKAAATPGAGGSRGAVKGRSGSADAAGPSAAATANGGSGRQQPAPQQPPAPPPQPQQHNAKPAGAKKRRGSSAYGPSGAAPNRTAMLNSALLHPAISEPSTPLPAATPASVPSSQPSTAPASQPYQSSASAAAAFAPAWDFMPPPPAAAGSAPTAAAAGTAPAPVSSSAPDDDDDASRLCVMCLDGPRRFGFLHGTTVHTGVCEECSALLQGCMPGLECPLCRVRVETIVALY